MVKKAKLTSPTMAAAKGEKKTNSPADQIKELEKEIANTKYNKATQHHIGMLKAKIAQLREKQELRQKQSSGAGDGYSVRKTGDGTVVLLGFPSVGKSTLLNTLTNANSEVGAYAFTTLSVIPGLMKYKEAQIQILDVPGIVEGAAAGTGRGKEVLQVIRNADLIIRLIDVFHPEHHEIINREAHAVGVRLNKREPDVKIVKTGHGGLDIGTTIKLTKMDKKTIEGIFKNFKINNAQVVIRSDIDADDLIDAIQKRCVYVPALTVVNKSDMVPAAQVKEVMEEVHGDIAISAYTRHNIETLKELIFGKLDLIRLYMKEVGKKADMEEPLIMHAGGTLKHVCEKLHRNFVKRFRYARIWGDSAKFDAQVIRKLSHEVKDGDVIELTLL